MSQQTAAANAARRRNPRDHAKKLFQVVALPAVLEAFSQLDPRQRGEVISAAMSRVRVLSVKVGRYRLMIER